MNLNQKYLDRLVLQFLKIINRYNTLEKNAIDFGSGEKLYPSEIHTIEAIGNNGSIIVTDLAELMGVTKGAVSQMISKLHKKGLVQKKQAHDNNKEVLLSLTKEGLAAHMGHARFHRGMYEDFTAILNDVSPQQFEFFSSVLEKIDTSLEKYYKKTAK